MTYNVFGGTLSLAELQPTTVGMTECAP